MRGILIIYFVGINLVTFLLYGVDKWKARKGRWRIPEDSLIWLAVVDSPSLLRSKYHFALKIGAFLSLCVNFYPLTLFFRVIFSTFAAIVSQRL